MYNSDNRLKLRLAGLVLGGALALTGCATTGQKTDVAAPEQTQAQAAQDRIKIEYVNVVGDGAQVMIGTTGSVKYTVFKLSDPPRLIIDMPGVDMESIAPALSVENSFIKDITAVAYGEAKEIGRVTINLNEGIEHEVKAGENSILVSLSGAAQAVNESVSTSEKAAPAETVAAPLETEPVVSSDLPVESKQKEAAAVTGTEKAGAPATKILKIESSKEGENTILKIVTDGSVGNYNSFELDTPARIVVDVWGIGNSVGKDTVKIKDKYVKAVRIGSHQDKSRLVFDAAGKKLPSHNIAKIGDALVITLGPGVKAEEKPAASKKEETGTVSKGSEIKAVAAKAETPAVKKAVEEREPVKTAQAEQAPAVNETENGSAPAVNGTENGAASAVNGAVNGKEEASATNGGAVQETPAAVEAEKVPMVEKVDFRKLGDKARLTIAATAKAEYAVKESQDGKTLIIDIKGAVIPENLSRTLDATKLKTTVNSISSYQESISPKDVRVLVKLSEKTAFEVKDENGTVNIDFALPAEKAETAAAATAETAAPAQAPKKAEEAVEAKKEFTGKRIDLDMVDANIADVLRLLAEVSNLNIIASDDVKGQISLRLKDVPWDQAFEIILKSKDLDSVREGNVVRVAPASKLRQEREALLASKKAQEKLEPLDIRFIPVNYAKAEELIKQVKGVLTERGDVAMDARTNTLIVKDVKLGISSAENLIKRLDTPVPQVLIEARIVEASSSFARDLGIQWGIDYTSTGRVRTNTFGSTTQTGQAGIDPAQQRATFDGDSVAFGSTKQDFQTYTGATNYAVNLPATGTAGTLGALGFLIGKAGHNPLILDLRLSAGESEGLLKTISRPRITTMDNKEAKIEQGESIPFETTSASGTATTFIDANLSLLVTPHITPDGSVLMKIKASRNSIGTFRTAAGEPSINKKESMTEVLVRDGETTVIGGIVVTDKNDSEKGIPFLKDIPLLGWLFKSRSISDTQTELLIFITPTIIKDKIVG